MQYTEHKSLTAYIREQTWPRLILPMVLIILCSVTMILAPISKKIATPADSLLDAALLYSDDAQMVSVSTDKLYDSGLALYGSTRARARVYYTFESNKCYIFVLTASPFSNKPATFDGLTVSAALTKDEDLYKRVCEVLSTSLEFSNERLTDMVSPIIFNQYEYDNGFATFAVYGLHIFLLLSLLLLVYWLVVLIFPQLSISAQRMRHYGKVSALYSSAITEFAKSVPIGRRNLYVTDSFFIALLKEDIIIQPLANITWLYQTHEVHHPHGQAKMFHTLCIVTDHKKIHKIPRLSEPVIASLINAIASGSPDIKIGNAWKGK